MIRNAEKSKARIFAAPGKDYKQIVSPTAIVDKGYIVVSAHLDENMIRNISCGEYVDFGKLIPHDRVMDQDDDRYEMIVKNGKTFWVPASNSQSVNIGSFSRWEQAYHVFSNIYCKANPSRAAELIEYNHIIHTAALTFVWDNVYMYDKEFRLHMLKFPHRSWAMILQQAWTLRLKDRLSIGFNHSNNASGVHGQGKISEPCRRFNRGKCNFGTSCKYDHKCSYCFKFGHGAVNCRKAMSDRNLDKGRQQERRENMMG